MPLDLQPQTVAKAFLDLPQGQALEKVTGQGHHQVSCCFHGYMKHGLVYT